MKNLAKVYLNNVLSKVLPQGIAFIITIILTHNLGVKGYGGLTGLIIICQIVYFSVTSALDTNLLRETNITKTLLSDNILLLYKVGIILYLPFFLICYFSKESSLIAATFLWVTHVLIQQNNLYATYFRLKEKDTSLLIIRTLPYVFLLLLLFIFKSRLSIITVSVSYFISWLSPLLIFYLTRKIPKINILNWKIKSKRQEYIILSSYVLIANTIFTQINGNADQLLLNYLVDSYSLGLYRICFILANLIMPIIGVFSYIYLSNLQNKKAVETINEQFRNQIFLVLFVLFCFSIFMYLFADLILNKLYYINDSLAINTLRILPIGLLFNGIAQVVSYTLLFYKRDKVMLYSLMLSSIFNVVLNFLIIPKYGIIGCAWLSVFTQFLNCAILFLYYLKNKLNGSFSRT